MGEVIVRPLDPARLDAANHILCEAYGVDGMLAGLQRTMAIDPGSWLMAWHAGAPVGMVGAIAYPAHAWIGQLGVLPAARGLGAGSALMQRLLADLERRGSTVSVLDATDAGARLYAHLGFVTDDRTLLYALPAQPAQGAGVERLRPSQAAELIAFDARLYGTQRTIMLARYLEEFPAVYCLRDAAGALRAYALRGRGRIGPWLGVDATAARAVFAAALGPRPLRVIVPAQNRAAAAIVEAYGGTLERTLAHMRRGGCAPAMQRDRVFGQASFMLG